MEELDLQEIDARLSVDLLINQEAARALQELSDSFWELRKQLGIEIEFLVQYLPPDEGYKTVIAPYIPSMHPPFNYLNGALHGQVTLYDATGKELYALRAIFNPRLKDNLTTKDLKPVTALNVEGQIQCDSLTPAPQTQTRASSCLVRLKRIGALFSLALRRLLKGLDAINTFSR